MFTFMQWMENKRSDLANLQPSTVVTCFHGTTAKYAYQFCTNGIDGRHVNHYRVYNQHASGGKPLKFGIFIAPSTEVAFKFGSHVIKFRTQAKNLIHMFPAEMKKYDAWRKEKYPNSFRPSVSGEMLTNPIEPQALFVGLISPRAIEKVYVWENGVGAKPMSPEEFVKIMDEKDSKLQYNKSAFEPQEYKMSLQDFAKRIADHEGGTPEEIIEILKNVYKRHGYLTGIGNIPYSLLRRIENQVKKLI